MGLFSQWFNDRPEEVTTASGGELSVKVTTTDYAAPICRNCGGTAEIVVHSADHPNVPGFLHCNECGQCIAPDEESRCLTCGAVTDPDDKACMSCS